MQQPFIFTSLGIIRGKSKRGNRKCGPENRINCFVLAFSKKRKKAAVRTKALEMTLFADDPADDIRARSKVL